jgi:hemoglobin-like flavoprotein
MTPEQIALVQGSWQQVMPIKDKAAELLYGRLFAVDPALKPLFKGDMAEQGRKLTAMLTAIVTKLNHLDELVPAAQALGRRHAGYGVKEEHYAIVGDAFLWTLRAGLGDAFTEDIKSAWIAAYTTLANVMIDAAAAG